MGRVYGVQGRHWRNSEGKEFDQLRKIYDDLREGIDDRGEILTFYNPGSLIWVAYDLVCILIPSLW